MSVYDLPVTAVIGGVEQPIRSDYRAVLDVIQVMTDPELADDERALLVLSIFYPDFDAMRQSDYQAAIDYAYWFIGGGSADASGDARKPRLMDWEQDFPLVVAPVNRVLGFEVRSVEYMHWWTFLAAYYEIGGDCLFAQVVSIRKKRSQGKKLDKADEAFLRENRDLVELRAKETEEDAAALAKWMGA